MRRLFIFPACVVLLCACGRGLQRGRPEEGTGATARFTVKEARAFVTGELAAISSPVSGGEVDSVALKWYEFFCFEGLTPQWEHAITGEAYGLDYVEAPFDLPHKYLQAVWDERDAWGAGDIWINDTPRFYPVPVRLHILRDPETNATAAYLCFYVPEEEFAEEFAGLDERKWAYPLSPLFSGTRVYTTLCGELVSAYKIEQGECLYGYDAWTASSDDWESLECMLSSVFMGRILSAQTRAEDPGILIETVVCWGKAPRPRPKPDFTINDFKLPPPLPRERPAGSGGGAGTGTGTGNNNSSKQYAKNKSIIFSNPRVEKLLDQLMEDCMGRAVISFIDTGAPITIDIVAKGAGRTHSKVPGKLEKSDITIGEGWLVDFVLMEELIHVAQAIYYLNNMKPMLLNAEVEAKFGWYLYLQRTGQSIYDWGRLFGQAEDYPYSGMKRSFDRSTPRQPSVFYDAFRSAAQSLRAMKVYADENQYPYDDTKMEMSVLKMLMMDC